MSVQTTVQTAEERVAAWRKILEGDVRVDFHATLRFDLAAGTTQVLDGAQIYVPGETRGGNPKWVKDQMLVEDDRIASLRQLLMILGADAPPLPTVAEVADYLDVMNPMEGDNPNRHQIELVLMAIRGLARA